MKWKPLEGSEQRNDTIWAVFHQDSSMNLARDDHLHSEVAVGRRGLQIVDLLTGNMVWQKGVKDDFKALVEQLEDGEWRIVEMV